MEMTSPFTSPSQLYLSRPLRIRSQSVGTRAPSQQTLIYFLSTLLMQQTQYRDRAMKSQDIANPLTLCQIRSRKKSKRIRSQASRVAETRRSLSCSPVSSPPTARPPHPWPLAPGRSGRAPECQDGKTAWSLLSVQRGSFRSGSDGLPLRALIDLQSAAPSYRVAVEQDSL